jgi:hypothetical protein
MGHSAGFGYTLWAITQYLVMRYRPEHRIWLYAMGCSAGYGYVLWAIAQTNYQSAKVHNNFFLKLAISSKGTVMKKVYLHKQ